MERKQTHMAYGFITALAMIVINVLLHVAKLDTIKGLQLLGFVAFLIGIIMNAVAYSKANQAEVTFGQVFGSCFKATAIITLITIAWGFVSLYIFPEIATQALEQADKEMSKNPGLSEEQRDKLLDMTKKNFKLMMVMGALFGTLFFGAIFSVIGAAVAKKNPRHAPNPQ